MSLFDSWASANVIEESFQEQFEELNEIKGALKI